MDAVGVMRCLDLTALPGREFSLDDKHALLALAGDHEVASLCVSVDALDFFAAVKSRLTTVINFPRGDASVDDVCRETQLALSKHSSELDVVWHYSALPDMVAASEPVAAVEKLLLDKKNMVLKVIMETAAMDQILIYDAASYIIRIHPRVTFLKTSTGKHSAGGASSLAVDAICRAIRDSGRSDVGVKVSGGVKTLEDALHYMSIVQSVLGAAWLTPERFRIGASGLMNDILSRMSSTTTSHDLSKDTY